MDKQKELRKLVRLNAKHVMAYIDRNYIRGQADITLTKENPVCMICASTKDITREHIIPRWLFLKRTEAFFNVTLNGLPQTYNKATIPVCKRCNSELLNDLERNVQKILINRDVKKNPIDADDSVTIIRWLELIDYKFQIYNITRTFKVSKTAGHIPELADIPLYMLLQNKDYTPFQVLSAIRRALNRQAVAGKWERINSLVVFKTSNKGNHLLHTIDDFIFLEMPQYQIALFYFYVKSYDTTKAAYKEAMEVLKKVY